MRRGRGIPGVSIFKLPGRKEKYHKWAIEYQEKGKPYPTRRCISADYEITRRFAVMISRQLDEQRLGLFTDRDRKFAEHAVRPLLPQPPAMAAQMAPKSHLEEYRDLLLSKGCTPKWVQMIESRIATLFQEAEFELIEDISEDGVDLALGSLAEREEWADSNVVKYQKAAKQFTRWLRRARRARFDELEDMPLRSIVELAHRRRALDELEIKKLLSAAAAGDDYVWWGSRVISGAERQLLYILALETGLRANELRTLTPESFIFEDGDPRVVVEARYSKHRRRDELLLKAATAQRFRKYLAGRRSGKPIWALPDKPYLMMAFDLEAAGIPYTTLYGVADFHALRHTFCTRLAASAAATRNGVKTCQTLMRHSDIRVTARYMHTTLHDQLATLEALPDLNQLAAKSAAQKQQQKKTGTYDTPAAAQPTLPFQRSAQEIPFPALPEASLPFPIRAGLTPAAAMDNVQPASENAQISPVGLRSRRLQVRLLQGALPQLPPPQEDQVESKDVNDIFTSALSVPSAGSAGSELTLPTQSPGESTPAAAGEAPITPSEFRRMLSLLEELRKQRGGGQ